MNTKKGEKVKKGVIYLRDSTAEQVDSGLGLEAQEREVRKFAKRNGYEISGVYEDAGISGATEITERKGLMSAIESLKRGFAFFVMSRDRLARDLGESAIAKKLIKKKGAEFIPVRSGPVHDPDDPSAILLANMEDVIAEHERRIIKKRTKDALKSKRKRSEKTGGPVPFGWRIKDYRTETRTISGGTFDVKIPILEPRPDEQKVIDLILEMRSNGKSYRKIKKVLNERKLGKPVWHTTQVFNIINKDYKNRWIS